MTATTPDLDPALFHVRHKRCETCIFGKRSPISQDALDAKLADIKDAGTYQECHSFTMRHGHGRTGPGVACRGFYDKGDSFILVLARMLGNVVFTDDDGQSIE